MEDRKLKEVEIYTDGACSGNPGAGGWAAILVYNGIEKVITGGQSLTTNNRMELLAVIEGLKILKEPCKVIVKTDSRYVTDAVNKEWVYNWEKQKFAGRKNAELWIELLKFLRKHTIKFIWIKGHNEHPYNERCDKLAKKEISKL